MDNQNRNLFSLHGITGMLIATVLLLSILAVLVTWSVKVQQKEIRNPYKLEKIEDVKKIENRSLEEFRKDAKWISY